MNKTSVFTAFSLVTLSACGPQPKEAEAPVPDTIEVQVEDAPILLGRWGITEDVCAETNTASNGVIEITETSVSLGLERCDITETVSLGDGGAILATTCPGAGGGEATSRQFVFSKLDADTLAWKRDEPERRDTYARCGN